MAEIAGFEFKFYQKLEGGRKAQIKLETVERLSKPFGLEAWTLIAPENLLKGAKPKLPRPRSKSARGPRAKWKGIAKS
jgi:hypothetical protein